MANCAKAGCKAHSLRDGDGYCFTHSQRPDVVKKRAQGRKRGGRTGKLRVVDNTPLASIEDVRVILAETLTELRNCASNNIVAKARAIGYLCGVALTAIEKGDLEERIAKLEESMAESAS